MTLSNDAVLRFERRLVEAVERFAAGLCRHVGGVPPAEIGLAGKGGHLAALLAEEGRLRRKARRNAPCYDLNRHIAVRRLIATGGALPAR